MVAESMFGVQSSDKDVYTNAVLSHPQLSAASGNILIKWIQWVFLDQVPNIEQEMTIRKWTQC